jgi:hypothetical protein
VKVNTTEANVNKLKTSKSTELGATLLALIAVVFVLTVSSASAKERKPKSSATPSQVVAHIPFEGLSMVDMTMPNRTDKKRYVYVQHGSTEGVSVIDVSNPEKAKVLRTIPWPNSQVSNRLNIVGEMAIIGETETIPDRRSSASTDVVLWDLSNPTAPRELQKFAGVVRVLEDDDNFIYVLNAEGLWVISEPERRSQQDGSDAYGG